MDPRRWTEAGDRSIRRGDSTVME